LLSLEVVEVIRRSGWRLRRRWRKEWWSVSAVGRKRKCSQKGERDEFATAALSSVRS
jgi:hypothetical protein